MMRMRIVNLFSLAIGLSFLIISQASAGQPSGSAYLEGHGVGAKTAVILLHGRGQSPTWLVVDPLRKGINTELGFHTLSLQMPQGVLKGRNKDQWDDYGKYFPEAYLEIQTGIAFLQKEKGVEKIYLMGHSMGSRMGTAFLAANLSAPIVGFIGVGIENGGADPLDSNRNLHKITIPVIDVFGDAEDNKNPADSDHAKERADLVSERYLQVLVPGATHTFDGKAKEMLSVIVNWLKKRQLTTN
jgi:predicted alpha/beta-hydrolase family hydrolase